MRFISLALIVLVLAGCDTVSDMSFMPSGYTYLNEYYKSPPGPETDSIGYAYTKKRNDAALAQWHAVVANLVGRMETELGLGPQQVYIETLPRSNAFNESFDYALREELRDRGYTLNNTRRGILHLRYEAFRPGDENRSWPEALGIGSESTAAEDLIKENQFSIALIASSRDYPLGEVRDLVNMSAYGYVPGEGFDKDHLSAEPKIVEVHPKAPDNIVVQSGPEPTPGDTSQPQSLLPPPIEEEPLQ